MIEHLEYRFRESPDKRRPGLFEIAAPKRLVDLVTSGYGPMLDETRANAVQKLVQRTYDGEGGITLWFDLDMLGRGWKGKSEDRAQRALALAAQLDVVATSKGMADPRIHFTAPYVRYAPDDFSVSFVQPQGDPRVTAIRIEEGMWRAAALLPSGPTNNRDHIRAVYSNDNGSSLRTRRDSGGDVLSIDPDATPEPGRIEMIGNTYYMDEKKEAQARLIALIGIISALDPIHSPEN